MYITLNKIKILTTFIHSYEVIHSDYHVMFSAPACRAATEGSKNWWDHSALPWACRVRQYALEWSEPITARSRPTIRAALLTSYCAANCERSSNTGFSVYAIQGRFICLCLYKLRCRNCIKEADICSYNGEHYCLLVLVLFSLQTSPGNDVHSLYTRE